jgi:putative ABC transport system permease protein
MNELIQLQPEDLLLSLGLIAIAIGLSFWQGLGLEWRLALGAGRTVLQLTIVGYILGAIFAWKNPLAVLAVLVVMLTIAAIEARNRIGKKIPWVLPLVWGSIWLGTTFTLAYVNLLVVRPQTWYSPQYLIPLGGMILGNAMNGAAISGERLTRLIQSSRQEIETHLCLGATPQQAIANFRKESIRAGLIPTLNSMMVVGIVQLPGSITGQLLSGVDPEEAAAYQILIMLMVAFSTLVTAILVTAGLYRQFFNKADQLLPL